MTKVFEYSEIQRFNHFNGPPFHRLVSSHSHRGFTLLEVLVSLAILGIAITIILQLFSANLRALSTSEDYVSAVIVAEAKMREILDDEDLSEKSWSEVTDDGYMLDVSITETLEDRTDDLRVQLLEVALTVHWAKGTKERALTLKTTKVVSREI